MLVKLSHRVMSRRYLNDELLSADLVVSDDGGSLILAPAEEGGRHSTQAGVLRFRESPLFF